MANETLDKYLYLARELKYLRNMKLKRYHLYLEPQE